MKSFIETVVLGMGYLAKDKEDAIRWYKEHPLEHIDDPGSMCDTCAKECKSKSFSILACDQYQSSAPTVNEVKG